MGAKLCLLAGSPASQAGRIDSLIDEFQGATFSNRIIPGTASPAQSQKNPCQPSVSTSQPAEALIKVRGTAARLVKSAIWVAV